MITPDRDIELMLADADAPDATEVGWTLLDALSGAVVVAPTTDGVQYVPIADAWHVAFTVPRAGAFAFRWIIDDVPAGIVGIVVYDGATPPASVPVPTVQDVADILRARTTDYNGNELGRFTADTRPTANAVAGLILTAMGNTFGSLTVTPCSASFGTLRSAAALQAAMLVESSYFPEQVASDHSPFNNLLELWRASFGGLSARVESICGPGSEDPDDPDGPNHYAGHSFMPDRPLGRRTRF